MITKSELLLLRTLSFTSIFIIGIVCNFMVIVNNDGNMPAKNVDAFSHENYIAYDDTNINEIKYEFLADRYGMDTKDYNYRFSLGDVLMVIGFIGLSFNLIWFLIIKRKEVKHGK
jgi:hypothetical protein